MADFCKQCSEETFGKDFGDLAFPDCKVGQAIKHCLCEGCGPECIVDPTGLCISDTCLKRHGLLPSISDDIIIQERGIVDEYLNPPDV
jgi:hypothetical protein